MVLKLLFHPDKKKEFVYKLLANYKKNITTYLTMDDFLTINDV